MKNIFRNLIMALLFLMMSYQGTFAQFFYSASVLPISPSIYDSIDITDYLSTSASGFVLYSYSVSKSGNNITIVNCYYDPAGFDIVSNIRDTIRIGRLPAGLYNCVIYSRQYGRGMSTLPFTPCDSLEYLDSFKFAFTVSQYPNSISDIDFSTISIAPNPSRNKLTINSAVSDMDISVFDASGRAFNVPHTRSEIDISSLANGVYCLHIRSREGSVVRRFVKE